MTGRYKNLVRDSYNLKAIKFDDITPGQFYKLVDFSTKSINPPQKYIRVIRVLKEGSNSLESVNGTRPIFPNDFFCGVWYRAYNLDECRKKLVAITYKSRLSDLESELQSDYNLSYCLLEVNNEYKAGLI